MHQQTRQSHQCWFIAQSVQTTGELTQAIEGGDTGQGRQASLRILNYNVVFTYAV